MHLGSLHGKIRRKQKELKQTGKWGSYDHKTLKKEQSFLDTPTPSHRLTQKEHQRRVFSDSSISANSAALFDLASNAQELAFSVAEVPSPCLI